MNLSPSITVRESASPEETEAIGRELAAKLRKGGVVLLFGDLGAGKSVLARGIVHGLPGGEEQIVRSPTFVYVRHYPTDPPVQHVDLYRLPANSSPEDLGLDEWIETNVITIIEWPQRLLTWPFSRCIEVRIEVQGEMQRRLEIIEK